MRTIEEYIQAIKYGPPREPMTSEEASAFAVIEATNRRNELRKSKTTITGSIARSSAESFANAFFIEDPKIRETFVFSFTHQMLRISVI